MNQHSPEKKSKARSQTTKDGLTKREQGFCRTVKPANGRCNDLFSASLVDIDRVAVFPEDPVCLAVKQPSRRSRRLRFQGKRDGTHQTKTRRGTGGDTDRIRTWWTGWREMEDREWGFFDRLGIQDLFGERRRLSKGKTVNEVAERIRFPAQEKAWKVKRSERK
ncbi:hypothetical protein B296_00015667 [Ensete ventricosum]|uniref:Uncharacterized protein n=1 Tax=Ensete ventricosum TaxID=4639 RepID=A0A427A0E4_ENSVE|nr:hypothetical protein B296_00015667 [Ensete ventricosum]